MRSDPESLAVMAAFNVWCSTVADVTAAAARATFLGEKGLGEQQRHGRLLLALQTREAYARGCLQSTLLKMVDGTDVESEIFEHWAEFWGQNAAESARERWDSAFALELAGLQQRHAAALERNRAHEQHELEPAPPSAGELNPFPLLEQRRAELEQRLASLRGNG